MNMKKKIFVDVIGQNVTFDSQTLANKALVRHRIVGDVLKLNDPLDEVQFDSVLSSITDNLFPFCRYRTWESKSQRLKGETTDFFYFPRGWPTDIRNRKLSIFQLSIRKPSNAIGLVFCSVHEIKNCRSWKECVEKRMRHYLYAESRAPELQLCLRSAEEKVSAGGETEYKDNIHFFEHLYDTYGIVWREDLGRYYWNIDQLKLPTRELAIP
jgi:hypothetical protein